MRWTDIHSEPCSIARTLSIIGDRWTLLVLRNAFLGTKRFDAFQRQLDVTRHLLTDRLNTLTENGILIKQPYQDNPPRYEYRLTEKGLDLYPIIMSLVTWGEKWLAEEPPFLEYTHRSCGCSADPVLVCGNCGDPLKATEVQVSKGPGMKPYLQDEELNARWGDVIKRIEQPIEPLLKKGPE